jgi:hypothetical protein
VEGKLSQVFDQVGVQLAIERALRKEAESSAHPVIAEVVAANEADAALI